MAKLTTKELTTKTWDDFDRLFSQGNGWDFCSCTAYQFGASGGRNARGRKLEKVPRGRAEWSKINRRDKRALVESGRAHGILVFAGGEPVGWCQFGPASELPLDDGNAADERLWKITCFVTMKDHRSEGVAATALHAALAAIRKKGGGTVEGYPYAIVPGPPPRDPRWKDERQIVRRAGKVTYYAGKAFLRHDHKVDGLEEPVNGVYWRGTGMQHAGTVAMFEKEGFRAVGTLPRPPRAKSPWLRASRIVMRKTV
jgi:hypothetical protein